MTRTPEDFMRLHARTRGEDGYPQLRGEFVDYLDGARARPPTTAPLSPSAVWDAYAHLQAAYPKLAASVRLWCLEGQSMRAAARTLDVSLRTVHVRAWEGLAQMAVWCGALDASTINTALRTHPVIQQREREG